MRAICDEFEAYGYRRIGAELRHRGFVINFKKVRRLMRNHDLPPRIFPASLTRSTTHAGYTPPRLPEPCAVRGSPRPAEGQNRRTATPGATVQLIAPIVFPPYWTEPEATKRGTDTGK